MTRIPVKLPRTIQNLIELSGSPYAAEAQSAAEKVNRLLLKYNTTLEELGIGPMLDIEIRRREGFEAGPWQERLLRIIAGASRIDVRIEAGTAGELYRLSGPAALIIVIRGIHEYIEQGIVETSSQFDNCIDDTESFRLGMIDAMEDRLVRLLRTYRKDVVTTEERNSASECRRVESQSLKTVAWDDWYGVDENSFGLGRAIGRKITVNLHIGDTSQERPSPGKIDL